jgi:nucleotide-binding universal stress UspA family protein
MSEQQTQGQRIVVGIDGSASAKEALRWAVGQAELTGAAIEAVIAWQFPAAASGYGWAPVPAIDVMNFEDVAAKVLGDSISECVDRGGPEQITSAVRQGNAAEVLLDCAKGADLLVIVRGATGQGSIGHAPVERINGRDAQ